METKAPLLAKTLTERSLTLATAESLTGGELGATITTIPGASKFYLGGVVAYNSAMKTSLLGVPKDLISTHTVVSGQVAEAMARGIQRQTAADWVMAVTGVAGPDSQDGHAPGEVWICVLGPQIASFPQFNQTEQFQFEGDRAAVRKQTIEAAFGMVLRVISPAG